MPRFLAVHPVAFGEEQLMPLAKEQLPEGVIWNSTYCSVADNLSYCHWEAPSRDAVAEVFTKYQIPYDAIHEVRHFDPATARLEPEPEQAKIPQPV